MFERKHWLKLTEDEYWIIVHCLIDLRNKLLTQGHYTDAVDDVLLKMLKY